MTDYVEPFDDDAERATLGAMILSEKALKHGLWRLKRDDFYRDNHRTIFKALSETRTADSQVIARWLKDHGLNEPDKADIHLCLEACLHPSQARHYVGIVLEISTRRRMLSTTNRLEQVLRTGEDPALEIGELRHGLSRLCGRESDVKSAHDLCGQDFPPIKWLMEPYLIPGLTLFAGAAKLGKSWLVLSLGLAVASGGQVLNAQAESGDVLYIALEDSERRLRGRIEHLLQGASTPPDNLYIATTWPHLNEGGLEQLEQYLEENPDTALVVIDTYGRLRGGPAPRNSNAYLDDYQSLSGLQDLAGEHDTAVLLVHHTRKADDPTDPYNKISGTTGLQGAADTLWMIQRERGRCDASFHVTGRDIPDNEVALSFDGNTGVWTALGPAAEFTHSERRAEIIALLKDAGRPLSPAEISSDLEGVSDSTVRTLLRKMAEQGQIAQAGRGLYEAAAVKLKAIF